MSFGRGGKIIGMTLFSSSVLAYLGAGLLLYSVQNEVLFHPQQTRISVADFKRSIPADSRVSVQSKGGVLRGVFAEGNAKRPETWLYFGGNAEAVYGFALRLHRMLDGRANVVTLAYPGYGASDGSPSIKDILAGADAFYLAVANDPRVDAQKIVFVGSSLGTGAATYLSHKHRPLRTILFAPFDDLAGVAQARFPIFPLRLLMHANLESSLWAKDIQSPVRIFHGSEDVVIDARFSASLCEAWEGVCERTVIKGAGHNDLFEQTAVQRFLSDSGAP